MADGSSEQESTFPTWKPESRLEFINYIHESSLDQINSDLDRLIYNGESWGSRKI